MKKNLPPLTRVLSSGFVQLIDVMGCDKDVVDAARTSYGKNDPDHDEIMRLDDVRLLEYLMRHYHTTPFEMCELKFLVEVPMDCWRQWIRHRTASVNEYSTRYRPAIDRMEIAEEWRAQSTNNKQGSSGLVTDWPEGFEPVEGVEPQDYLSAREYATQAMAKQVYEERLRFGVAQEQARKDLPLSNYTRAIWKVDLHNLLNFLRLRCDSHAQLEIRQYANAILEQTRAMFPVTVAAFECYRLRAITLSERDQMAMQYVISMMSFDNFYQNVNTAEKLCDAVPCWSEALKFTGKVPREAEESLAKIKTILGL